MRLWPLHDRTVLLASSSPRRIELLGKIGIDFKTIKNAPLDEVSFLDIIDIKGSLAKLAIEKARQVSIVHPEAVVLSADTVVVLDREILGKPPGKTDARNMLLKLSGRCHQVFSAVALTCTAESFCSTRTIATNVYFRDLSAEEIEWYIDSDEPYDKAGGYGIQGQAMIFIDKIEGCFYNVVGLPVQGMIDLFKEFDAKGTPPCFK